VAGVGGGIAFGAVLLRVNIGGAAGKQHRLTRGDLLGDGLGRLVELDDNSFATRGLNRVNILRQRALRVIGLIRMRNWNRYFGSAHRGKLCRNLILFEFLPPASSFRLPDVACCSTVQSMGVSGAYLDKTPVASGFSTAMLKKAA